VLAINEFSEPVRTMIYALPVANGIRLFGDFMFRGGTVVAWQLWVMAGLAAAYTVAGWRRSTAWVSAFCASVMLVTIAHLFSMFACGS